MQPYSIEPLTSKESLPKQSWKKWVLIIGLCLLFSITAVWKIASSEWFLQTVLIPRVGESINSSITARSASWSIKDSIILRGVTLKAVGQQPCFNAEEIQLNYDIKELIFGDIHFHKVKVVKPKITVKMDSNGITNLDPFFNIPRNESGDVPLVHFGKIEIFQGKISFERQRNDGSEEHYIGSNFQLQAGQIGNSLKEGKLNISTGLQYVMRYSDGSTNSIEGILSLKTGVEFSREWVPEQLGPKVKVKIVQTSGRYEFAQGIEVDLAAKIKSEKIEESSAIFMHEGERIGLVTARGSTDIKNGNAELEVAMSEIDQQLMNFIVNNPKINFHSTIFNSDNHLSLTKFGKVIQITGSTRCNIFEMSYGRMLLPSFEDLSADYRAQIDFASRRIDIRRFQLVGGKNSKGVLEAKLMKPMVLSWEQADIEAPDSTLTVSLTDVDAAELQPLLGRYVRKGRANLMLKIVSEKAGRQIGYDLSGDGVGLTVPLAARDIAVGNMIIKSEGKLVDFNELNVSSLKAQLGDEADPVLSVSWPFQLDFKKKSISGKLDTSGQLPVLLAWFPKIKVNCKSGTFSCNGSLDLKFDRKYKQNFEGEFLLHNLTGSSGKFSVTDLTAQSRFKLSLTEGNLLEVGSFNAEANIGNNALLTKLYMTGSWDIQNDNLRLSDFILEKVDLKLVNQIIPLGVLRAGKADASLRINHSNGQKAKTSVIGNVRLFGGRIAGFPESINVHLSKLDGILFWDGNGRFLSEIKDFRLEVFNKEDLKRRDASFAGSIAEYNPFTGQLKCTLNKGEVLHPILQILFAEQLRTVGLVSGKISHSKPLKINIHDNGLFEIKGNISGENFIFVDPDKPMPSESFSFVSDIDVSYGKKNSDWALNATTENTTIILGKQKVGRLSVGGKYQSNIDTGNYFFTINNLDYRIINLLPDSILRGTQMNAGRVDRLEANGKISNGEISGRLGASIKGLNFKRSNGFWPAGPFDMEHSFEGTIGLSTFSGKEVFISSDNIRGSIKQNENPIAQYDVNGSIKGEDYHINIRSIDLGPEIATAALAEWNFNEEIRSGRISVRQAEFIFPKLGSGKFSGGIEFKGFEMKSKASDKPSMNLDSRFKIDAEGQDRVFHIKNFVASIPRMDRAANQLMVTGALDLTDVMKPALNLKVNSDALDITPFMDLLNENNLLAKSRPENTSNEISKGKDRFGLKRLLVDLDIKRLFWSDLNAAEVVGRVRMEGRKIELLPLQMRLLKSPVMIEGFIIPGSGYNISYDLNISCQNLALDPVVNHFHPENDVKWGRLTANFRAKGEALKGETFKRTFTVGGIDPELPAFLKIEGSHWAFKEEGFITSVIAKVLLMPELLQSHFNTAELGLRVKEGDAELKFMMAGPLIRLKVEGDGKMNDRIIDTSVNTEVEVEVDDEVYRLGPGLPEHDGFVRLPDFITVKGPLSNPEYELDKVTVAGIVTGNIIALPVKVPLNILGRILPFID